MKYYYDGCDPGELQEILEKGCVSGVTTNVNFVIDYAKKTNINSYFKAVQPIYNIAVSSRLNIPFSVQALGETSEKLIESALKIRDSFSNGVNLYIKIPVNYDNLSTIKFLSSEENINVNATCITSFLQATLAFNSGAKILSYFWGKMTDEGIDPRDHVTSLKRFINANNSDAKILCGSIRQSRIIHEALMSEADILTLPFAYFSKISERKKSEEATNIFNEAWNKSNMIIS